MAKLYIVETADGEWRITRSTAFRERFHLVPRVQPPGVIALGKSIYVLDSSRTRRIPYRPWRFLKMSQEYHQVYVWRELDPEQRPLFGAPPSNLDITGDVMYQLGKSKRLRDLMHQGADWRDVALILLILVVGIMGLALYALAAGGKL